jgi:hypothetical protein
VPNLISIQHAELIKIVKSEIDIKANRIKEGHWWKDKSTDI